MKGKAKYCNIDSGAVKVPEVALALAVVQRAVADACQGGGSRKREAVEDIKAGALDYWIDVAATEYEVADAIKRHLVDLVG